MKSIGQILKTARQKKNFSVDDVYKFIKIHPSYLKALENDDYSVFDGRVHSKGFLKIYAEFLELDLREIMLYGEENMNPLLKISNQKNLVK